VAQLNEYARRWQEMSVARGWSEDLTSFTADQMELVLNAASPVVKALAQKEREGAPQDELCLQIYDLARLSAGFMERGDLAEFLRRSQRLLKRQLEQEKA